MPVQKASITVITAYSDFHLFAYAYLQMLHGNSTTYFFLPLIRTLLWEGEMDKEKKALGVD